MYRCRRVTRCRKCSYAKQRGLFCIYQGVCPRFLLLLEKQIATRNAHGSVIAGSRKGQFENCAQSDSLHDEWAFLCNRTYLH